MPPQRFGGYAPPPSGGRSASPRWRLISLIFPFRQTRITLILGAKYIRTAFGACADLEQRLRQIQSDLDAEKKTQADWEKEPDRRTARRKEFLDLLAAAKGRLQTLTETPGTPEGEASAVVRVAQQNLLQIRELAIERGIQAYNSKLLTYDARRDLLQARLDHAARRVGLLEKLLPLGRISFRNVQRSNPTEPSARRVSNSSVSRL